MVFAQFGQGLGEGANEQLDGRSVTGLLETTFAVPRSGGIRVVADGDERSGGRVVVIRHTLDVGVLVDHKITHVQDAGGL